MMRGQGCYIDTTSAHTQPFWQGVPAEVQATAPENVLDPLNVASDRSIEAHTAIVQMGDATIRQASETVLWLLGRALERFRFALNRMAGVHAGLLG